MGLCLHVDKKQNMSSRWTPQMVWNRQYCSNTLKNRICFYVKYSVRCSCTSCFFFWKSLISVLLFHIYSSFYRNNKQWYQFWRVQQQVYSVFIRICWFQTQATAWFWRWFKMWKTFSSNVGKSQFSSRAFRIFYFQKWRT